MLQVGQHGVEALVPLLGPALVALDPLGHQVEDLRLQVHGPALGVAALGHQPGPLEHLQVLGDGLHADVVRRRELADGRVTHREAGHEVAPGGVGESREDGGELVGHGRPFSTNWLNMTLDFTP